MATELILSHWLSNGVATYLEAHPEHAEHVVTGGNDETVRLALALNVLATVPHVASGEAGADINSASDHLETQRLYPEQRLYLEQSEIVNPVLMPLRDAGGGVPESFWQSSPEKRAELVYEHATMAGGDRIYPVRPADLAQGRERALLAFSASCLNAFSRDTEGQRKPEIADSEEKDVPSRAPKKSATDAEQAREERVFKLWASTLDTKIELNDLTTDCQTGVPLLAVLDQIEPKSVDWTKVLSEPKSFFERLENCNYAVEVASRIGGLSLVGIGGADIAQGSTKLTLALWWQLMRKDCMRVIASLGMESEHVLAWANASVAATGSKRRINGFGDAKLKDGVFVLQLLHSVSPECVDEDLILEAEEGDDDPLDEHEKKTNAMYAVSSAHKIGCKVFLVWQDIVEARSKMILCLFVAAMQIWMERRRLSTGQARGLSTIALHYRTKRSRSQQLSTEAQERLRSLSLVELAPLEQRAPSLNTVKNSLDVPRQQAASRWKKGVLFACRLIGCCSRREPAVSDDELQQERGNNTSKKSSHDVSESSRVSSEHSLVSVKF